MYTERKKRKEKLNKKNVVMNTRINDGILNEFIDVCKESGVKFKSKAIMWFILQVITEQIKLDSAKINEDLKNSKI